MNSNKIPLWLMALASISILACQHDFLDIKPDKKLVVPSTLSDLQALLDNTSIMNESMPSLGEVGSDDYYVLDNRLQSQLSLYRNAYLWATDIFEGNNANDWDFPYRQVFYANVVLEKLKTIDKSIASQQLIDNVEGSALFYRSWAFFQIAQLFCPSYDASTAVSTLGIPLRKESDVTQPSKRSSVKETYRQINEDLLASLPLLPSFSNLKTRPTKSSAFGLLARTSLITGDFKNALAFADSCLANFEGGLINFNDLDINLDYPFARFNQEVIFHATMFGAPILNQANLIVDSVLYANYSDEDIRKVAFFVYNNGYPTFRGSYDNSRTLFAGIALNEILLVKAECLVRLGNEKEAIDILNMLMIHRFYGGRIDLEQPGNVLERILWERRKELVYRGIRWQDLRRLNPEPEFSKTLVRKIGTQIYELAPGAKKYVLPIPNPIISMTGMEQNPR